MTAEKPDRIYSTVRQSFSRGRSRIVQVEIIPSTELRSKKRRSRKVQKKAKQAVALAVSPAEKSATGRVHKLKKNARGKSRAKPSFLSSTSARSRIIGSGKIKGLKKSSSGGVAKGGGAGNVGLSAGLPGNEDVDPPVGRSTSTPGDRWRDRLR
jgi:hypothetical protein